MEKKTHGKNFWDYYLDPEKENKESAEEFLKKAGINAEIEKKKLMEYLNKEEAEITLKRGKEFKEEYLSKQKEDDIEDAYEEGIGVQYAYRNSDGKDNADEDTLKEDMKKMKKIKKIKDKNDSDSES